MTRDCSIHQGLEQPPGLTLNQRAARLTRRDKSVRTYRRHLERCPQIRDLLDGYNPLGDIVARRISFFSKSHSSPLPSPRKF